MDAKPVRTTGGLCRCGVGIAVSSSWLVLSEPGPAIGSNAPGPTAGRISISKIARISVVRTGMAVAIDVGDPARKQEIGDRLALLTRSIAYGQKIVVSGPLFHAAAPVNNAP